MKYMPVLAKLNFSWEYIPGPGALDLRFLGNLTEQAGLISLVQEFLYFDIGYLPVFEIPGSILYYPGPGTFIAEV